MTDDRSVASHCGLTAKRLERLQMSGRKHDIAIAGGGLAGGLIALALQRARPDLSVVMIEQGASLGGNHRWSWFASDLTSEGAQLLARFRKVEWSTGYQVAFPAHSRDLRSSYASLASADFDAALRRELAPDAIRCRAEIASLDARGVTLANGEHIAARAVIDCRGFEPTAHLTGGWQLFMGRHLRTAEPHHVSQPVIMDARVEQHDAYRFVYVLPLGADELFVEDTYYANSPKLDRRTLASRIEAYCAEHDWQGEILGNEVGVLPVITGGNFAAYQAERRIPGVAMAGARGLFVHPLTSYSLPQAVATALAIAADADLSGEQMAAMLEDRARRHWRATRFYRRLGAMLFTAAEPDQRYRIFERFYRLPEGLIERFYAAHSTRLDRARILCGRPPVPIAGALKALRKRGVPLA